MHVVIGYFLQERRVSEFSVSEHILWYNYRHNHKVTQQQDVRTVQVGRVPVGKRIQDRLRHNSYRLETCAGVSIQMTSFWRCAQFLV